MQRQERLAYKVEQNRQLMKSECKCKCDVRHMEINRIQHGAVKQVV